MCHRVACHAINLGGGINLINAERLSQDTRCNLSGSGLFSGTGSSKGELAAGAHAEYTAHNALLTHADADNGVLRTVFFQKLHHLNVVIEIGRASCSERG